MARERERLDAARKRNAEAASLHGEATDDVESAWEAVFASRSAQDDVSAEEARKRKQQKKAEKRKEKAVSEAANAGSLTVYVSGIPRDIGWTAVQNLFSKAGEVKRVKLYKDASGEQKGDGLVTFAKESGVHEALTRGDWALFGESLTVTQASFSDKPEGTPRADWHRIVELSDMFSVEEIGAAPDPRAFITALEEETWLECARFGTVECIKCFSADPAHVIGVRFAEPAAAQACISAMAGRWFNERRVGAELYEGNRKRSLAPEVDEERQRRLVPPPLPPPAAATPEAPATAAGPEAPATAAGSAAAAAAAAASAKAAAMSAAEQSFYRETTAAAAPPPAAETITLPTQSYVKVRGLKKAPERNGQVGVVQSHDAASGRYTVSLRDGAALALKPANLLQAAFLQTHVRPSCRAPLPARRPQLPVAIRIPLSLLAQNPQPAHPARTDAGGEGDGPARRRSRHAQREDLHGLRLRRGQQAVRRRARGIWRCDPASGGACAATRWGSRHRVWARVSTTVQRDIGQGLGPRR